MGKPIISYVIKVVIKSKLFDEVIVSTDDNEIAEISVNCGAKVPFFRSKKNSDDFATTVDVIIEVLNYYLKIGRSFESALCIYPTSALVKKIDITRSYEKFSDGDFDSLIPIFTFDHPIQRALKINKKGNLSYFFKDFERKRTQDLEKSYYDSGQFYWFKTKKILKEKSLIMPNSSHYKVSNQNFQDIDDLEDWKLAEIKYKNSIK